ncbi:MAG: hypothetical protein HYX26_01485 [Acidobacteriales bacterium]|nr:hypothetical protein [Terriglobales bacterium]
MAGRPGTTFGKRQREQKRLEKRLQKAARKEQRKQDKTSGLGDEMMLIESHNELLVGIEDYEDSIEDSTALLGPQDKQT